MFVSIGGHLAVLTGGGAKHSGIWCVVLSVGGGRGWDAEGYPYQGSGEEFRAWDRAEIPPRFSPLPTQPTKATLDRTESSEGGQSLQKVLATYDDMSGAKARVVHGILRVKTGGVVGDPTSGALRGTCPRALVYLLLP